MRTLLSAIALVIATATSSLAMTPSELAKFASNYNPKEYDPVVYINYNSGCSRGIPVTLVKTINLGGGRIGGITRDWDCPIAIFTYFEMTRGNLESISVFTQVVAGRTSRFSNWSPASNPGEELNEHLEAVARAIDKYTK